MHWVGTSSLEGGECTVDCDDVEELSSLEKAVHERQCTYKPIAYWNASSGTHVAFSQNVRYRQHLFKRRITPNATQRVTCAAYSSTTLSKNSSCESDFCLCLHKGHTHPAAVSSLVPLNNQASLHAPRHGRTSRCGFNVFALETADFRLRPGAVAGLGVAASTSGR